MIFTWTGKEYLDFIINSNSNGRLIEYKEESVNFDETKNLYIEGDNLEVLKLLQKSYYGKIKMIYIDPPYNTGKDFVYKDNFKDNLQNYLEVTGQVDGEGKRISANQETAGRYHSNWLNMMYPRLFLARNLLKDDGVIFISIDDNEVHNLRKICDEVFGEDNFIADFPRVTKKAGKSSESISKNHDMILCFQKSDKSEFNSFEHTDEGFKFSDEYVNERGLYKLNQTLDYGSIQYSASLDYEIEIDSKIYRAGNVLKEEMEERKKRNPKSDFCWRWSKDLFEFGLKNGFIVVKEYGSYSRIYTKTYQNATISKKSNGYFVEIKKRTKAISTLEFIENKYSNDNSKKDLSKLFSENIFDYPKSLELIKKLLYIGANNDDIVLDFFSGSATTAHAVMQLNAEDEGNRKYIMVQLPETTDEKSEAYKAGYKNICEIGKERIRRAGEKILEEKRDNEGIDIGFKVLKLE